MSQFVEAMGALDAAITAERFHGYGPLRIPHELDALPEQLVRSFRSAETSEKELLSAMQRGTSNVLLVFSERYASLAARVQSSDLLSLSVLAVGLAAVIADDERGGMLVMPLPWRTAQLLKLKPEAVFEAASEELPPVGRKALTAFASRKAEDQTLKCMGYAEATDADGFRYVRTW